MLVSSIVTRSAARRIEPPPVQGERLAETILVPIDVDDDPAITRLAARLAMAKGGQVLIGAVATSRDQIDTARSHVQAAEQTASAVGAEAASVVRVDTFAAAALAAIAAEHGVTLVVTGWHRAALGAEVILGGRVSTSSHSPTCPLLAVLHARGDYGRVVLALDGADLDERLRPNAISRSRPSASPAAGVRGRVLVIAPDEKAAQDVAKRVGEGTETLVDRRSRREAVAAVAREDDLVVVPARSDGQPMPRDAVALASLPAGCSTAVPIRPHAAATLVTGTSTPFASRADLPE